MVRAVDRLPDRARRQQRHHVPCDGGRARAVAFRSRGAGPRQRRGQGSAAGRLALRSLPAPQPADDQHGDRRHASGGRVEHHHAAGRAGAGGDHRQRHPLHDVQDRQRRLERQGVRKQVRGLPPVRQGEPRTDLSAGPWRRGGLPQHPHPRAAARCAPARSGRRHARGGLRAGVPRHRVGGLRAGGRQRPARHVPAGGGHACGGRIEADLRRRAAWRDPRDRSRSGWRPSGDEPRLRRPPRPRCLLRQAE